MKQSQERLDLVKVFSVTKWKDRDALGAQVTDWIAANPAARIQKAVVAQTSDHAFHCYSIVLFCSLPS